jgi:16S rRNA (guanine966-N2)-methyltransferase
MRITGGEVRGRTIHFPVKSNQRPTSDFLREALFNLLRTLQDKTFLDIFAGSGSVGLEAASRGAKEVCFIEKDKSLLAVIRKNIESCGYHDKCRLFNADVESGVRKLSEQKYRVDIVFADPPFNRGWVQKTLIALKKNDVLKENGILVIQHSIREIISVSSHSREDDPSSGEDISQKDKSITTGKVNECLLTSDWLLTDQRKYGENVVSILRMDKK